MKILVFDIGGTAIKHSLCIDGLLQPVMETPAEASLGGRHIMDTVRSLIRRENGYEAIGISTAGQVDTQNGSVIYANSNIPNYTGMQIRQELENTFHVPVTVENDVNCAAIGEAAYGAAKGYGSFLCLTYGTGVGGAIVEGNTIYHGSGCSAGEFGGIITHGGAALRGNDLLEGCYERFASTTALVHRVRELDPSLTDGRQIFHNLGRPEIKRLVDSWIDEIILGLITVIHIFNPPCVILGGGIMSQAYIIEEINRRLYPKIMPSFAHVKILPARLGNSAGLLGANYLAERLFDGSR